MPVIHCKQYTFHVEGFVEASAYSPQKLYKQAYPFHRKIFALNGHQHGFRGNEGVKGKQYVGYTKDLKLRFEQHTKGQVQSTKHRLPMTLIYYEACMYEEDAKKRERYLKTHYGKMFLKNRLKSYFTGRTK